MVSNMKEIGKMVNQKDKEFSFIQMGPIIKEDLKILFFKEKEQ